MRPGRVRRVCAAVLLLALLASAAGAPAAAGSAETSDAALVQRVTVHLTPADPGHVDVTVNYTVGADVERLLLYPPTNATVRSTSGLARDGPTLDWDGRTESPTARLRVPVNESSSRFEGPGFVDVGPWALTDLTVSTAYHSAARDEWVTTWDGDPAIRVERTVAGPGHAGSVGVFLGAHRVYRERAAGTSFSLVVPEAADPVATPDAALAELTATARRHDVGARSEGVTVFVAPDPVRSGGLSFGSRLGRANVWVHESARVDGESVWVHEYVHTRQAYRPTNATRWLREASANYYGLLYPLREGDLSYRRFSERLQEVESGGALVAPATWDSPTTPYDRGALVVAALDAKIRNASGGTATFEDVARRLNAHEGNLTYAAFERAVAATAGRPLDDWLAAHVRGDAPVTFPEPHAFTAPDGEGDPDGDGVSSARERRRGTHPFRAPSDGPSTPLVLTVAALWIVAGAAAGLAVIAALAKGLRRLVGWAPGILANRSARRLVVVAVVALLLSAVVLFGGTALLSG